MKMLFLSIFIIAIIISSSSASNNVVDILDLRNLSSQSMRLTSTICAGLRNRDVEASAYVLTSVEDQEWFDRIGNGNGKQQKSNAVEYADFVKHCSGKQIKYDFDGQRAILPNLITLAGVLDAILIQEDDQMYNESNLVFDAVDTFGLNKTSAYDATNYMFERYIGNTTGMSKMNPGLDVHGHPLHPPLDGSISFGLADYIVKERLFNFFLNDGCIPLTKDHALMEKIVTNNPWPRPIAVYGYDDTFPVAGDLFEAETDCVKEHNMGQIASNGCANLAYFSSLSKPLTAPLIQNKPVHNEPYNKSKTYLGLVIGDGDNVNFIKGSRAAWMNDRVSRCENGEACFPLIWTLSPALRYLAPDWAKWYFDAATTRTKRDYFVLPPSGHTYSYPGQMSTQDQDSFVKLTEEDCEMYNTSVTVDWEFMGTWKHAIDNFYPKYSERNVVRGIVPVNVPYMFPVLELLETKYSSFDIVNDNVVLFQPNEWRGSGGGNPKIPFDHDRNLPAKDMADKINNFKTGTVEAIYITSDGGASLDLIYNMTQYLDEHVEIVSHEVLVRMASSAAAAAAVSLS